MADQEHTQRALRARLDPTSALPSRPIPVGRETTATNTPPTPLKLDAELLADDLLDVDALLEVVAMDLSEIDADHERAYRLNRVARAKLEAIRDRLLPVPQ